MVAPSPFKSVFYVNIGFPLKASCRSHKNYCNPQNLHHKRFLELELDYCTLFCLLMIAAQRFFWTNIKNAPYFFLFTFNTLIAATMIYVRSDHESLFNQKKSELIPKDMAVEKHCHKWTLLLGELGKASIKKRPFL